MRTFHARALENTNMVIIALASFFLPGCAISVGGANREKAVLGLLHLARTTNGETIVVDHRVLGLDVRIRTHNDGVTVGYSHATVVFPADGERERPCVGFRWPLGYAWMARDDQVLHELGFIVARVPEPGDVLLTHHRQLGAGCMLSRRCVGAIVGCRDRLYVAAPPNRDALYTVRYESDKPFDSILTVALGGQ